MQITETMQKTAGLHGDAAVNGFNYEWKYLATSEGSYIEQESYFTAPSFTATARKDGK